MESLTKITPDIHRIVVPFEDIYTTVFVIKTPDGAVLFDTATYPEDVEDMILPALTELGITAQMLKCVVLSHSHGDHAGGLPRLLLEFPEVCIISRNPKMRESYPAAQVCFPEDGEQLTEELRVLFVPGHSADSLALLDLRTGTLLTGDSLQLYGIYGSGNWGANISLPAEHLEAIEKLRKLELQRIIASHDYHPYGFMAEGSAAVKDYLDACLEALCKILEAIRSYPELEAEALAEQYNRTSGLPTVGKRVFIALQRAGKDGLCPECML